MPRPTHLHCSVNEFQLHEPPLTFGVVYENEKACRWDVACIKCGCMKRYSAAEFASKSVQDFAAIEKGQLMLNENDVITSLLYYACSFALLCWLPSAYILSISLLLSLYTFPFAMDLEKPSSQVLPSPVCPPSEPIQELENESKDESNTQEAEPESIRDINGVKVHKPTPHLPFK